MKLLRLVRVSNIQGFSVLLCFLPTLARPWHLWGMGFGLLSNLQVSYGLRQNCTGCGSAD
jgi:hypothetical protein